MHAHKKYPFIASLLLLTACVTINVYFPAAAAESAADKIIKGIYGEDKKSSENPDKSTVEPNVGLSQANTNFFISFLQSIIPAAQAQQPDINVSSPGINKLQSMMTNRHQQLKPYYDSGAVGMEIDGLISVRDDKTVALRERNTVKKLVLDENRDRNQLYQEIATANGHPEWEADIRKTFARRWIANAPVSWWYKDVSGSWQQVK